ncbi:MAG: hypothetical protein JWO13_3303 [Acidobacteriales bacterium]|nr:hypothetical protein [Terriglobales bacterium]
MFWLTSGSRFTGTLDLHSPKKSGKTAESLGLHCSSRQHHMFMASTVLNTWKDISAYTGRGIRTVQRWETSFEFPIHRPSGKSRSAVFALSDEVDKWFHSRPMLATEEKNKRAQQNPINIEELRARAHQLRARGDATQQLMLELQKNLQAALGKAAKYRKTAPLTDSAAA